MKAHERIGAALTAANDAGRPALVPFITAGYPEPTEFISNPPHLPGRWIFSVNHSRSASNSPRESSSW